MRKFEFIHSSWSISWSMVNILYLCALFTLVALWSSFMVLVADIVLLLWFSDPLKLESLCKFVSYKVGVQKYVIIGYVMDITLVIFDGRESIRGSFVQCIRTCWAKRSCFLCDLDYVCAYVLQLHKMVAFVNYLGVLLDQAFTTRPKTIVDGKDTTLFPWSFECIDLFMNWPYK